MCTWFSVPITVAVMEYVQCNIVVSHNWNIAHNPFVCEILNYHSKVDRFIRFLLFFSAKPLDFQPSCGIPVLVNENCRTS